MVMLLLLCITVTVLPVSIAFYDELNPGWLTVNIITDTLFILDIVVNFRTGILVQTIVRLTKLLSLLRLLRISRMLRYLQQVH